MQSFKYDSAVAATNQLQLQLSAANGDTHTVTNHLHGFRGNSSTISGYRIGCARTFSSRILVSENA